MSRRGGRRRRKKRPGSAPPEDCRRRGLDRGEAKRLSRIGCGGKKESQLTCSLQTSERDESGSKTRRRTYVVLGKKRPQGAQCPAWINGKISAGLEGRETNEGAGARRPEAEKGRGRQGYRGLAQYRSRDAGGARRQCLKRGDKSKGLQKVVAGTLA